MIFTPIPLTVIKAKKKEREGNMLLGTNNKFIGKVTVYHPNLTP